MGRLALAGLFLLAASACSKSSGPPSGTPSEWEATGRIEVLGSVPHQGAVWTEGLLVDEGAIWESMGRPTGSGVRALDPETGDVLWSVSNSEAFFAEGLIPAFL